MLQHSSRLLRNALITSAALLALGIHAQGTVKVVLLSTLSGSGAGLGVDSRDGFQVAVKLAAGKLGGQAVEVIVADEPASPDVGRQTADCLVKRDKVEFMTGVMFSNVMLAVGAPTCQSQTYCISANAGPSQFAGEQCNPFFFNASYRSILVIDKYLHKLVNLGDHRTIIERGKVVWQGDTGQLGGNPDVWHRYIGV